MRLTPYNQAEAIEMLRARAFLLLMSDEVRSVETPNAAALWRIVSDMSRADASSAIKAFEATQ